MFRMLGTIMGIVSTCIVLSQGCLVGFAWWKGYLSADRIREVQMAFQGESVVSPVETGEKKSETTQTPAFDEIRENRSLRILELGARQTELDLFKRMTSERLNQLISDHRALDLKKEQFYKELRELKVKTEADSVEQSRAIVLALPADAAIARIMGLSLDESIHLLKGMPEKSIARLLQGFVGDAAKVERGQKIFEALYKGMPENRLVESTERSLAPDPMSR